VERSPSKYCQMPGFVWFSIPTGWDLKGQVLPANASKRIAADARDAATHWLNRILHAMGRILGAAVASAQPDQGQGTAAPLRQGGGSTFRVKLTHYHLESQLDSTEGLRSLADLFQPSATKYQRGQTPAWSLTPH
jgi:hypothetical protein